MATEKHGIRVVKSGLAITMMLIAALVFMASADVVLAEDVPDGGTIQATQTVDGTWGPGVISATNSVAINAGVEITIAPNTTILVSNNRGITVTGDLHTDGPVVFTSASGTPGAWQSVTYAPSSTGSLNDVTIEYAQHALILNTANPVTVTNSTLRYNRHATTTNQDAFGAGLVIVQGNHLIEHTDIYSNTVYATYSGADVYGGGVDIQAGSPRILYSRIYENSASTSTGATNSYGGGGGILIRSGAPLIQYCEVMSNTLSTRRVSDSTYPGAGAGIGIYGLSDAEIRNNLIMGNANTSYSAAGGGIGFRASVRAAIIDSNVIANNAALMATGGYAGEGGGIDDWGSSVFTATNNLIYNNRTTGEGGGVATWRTDSARVYNNTIVSNTAASGGGVYCHNGSYYNNIIYGNTATTAGGVYRGGGTVNYNDIYGNSAPQTSGTMGAQNLYIDPVFLGTGDLVEQYHLSQASLLIDAGTSSGTGLPTTDYDGENRPATRGWDMGFDEVVPLLTVSKSADHDPVAPGDTLTYTIQVANVGQVGAISVTLSDPLPLHTAYVAGSSLVSLSGASGTYSDVLATVAYTGSNGTLDWTLKPWTEIGETNGPTAGSVVVASDGGDYSIRIASGSRGLSRRVDLSNYNAATLTFDYRRAGFDATSDYVMLQISNNGGTSWTELARYRGAATDSSYLSASYPISATYLVTNTMIRFYSSGLAADDYFYVDNVQIAASFAPTTTAGGTPPDLASVPMLLGGQQMTVTYAVEVDSPLAGGTQFTNTASAISTGMPVALESSVASTVIEVPPSAVDDSGATDEDTVLNAAAPGVLENDVDLNGDSLTVTTYDATSVAGAVVTVHASGSYSYDPTGVAAFQALAVGESVTDTFTYTMSDGHGGSDTATVTLTVSGVNDSPTTADDTGSTDEETALTVPAPGVLGNDTDPDATDTLTVTGYDAASGQGAVVTVNANGGYSYDPTGVAAFQALAAGESVTDTFTYTISDGHGGSDTATVTLTVNGVNDGPTAVDDSGTTDEDMVLNGTAPGVLENDTDPDDSDVLTVTGYDATSVQGASVTVNGDGSYSYDPTGAAALQALVEGTSVTDIFTYTLGDGHGGSDTATVSIDVTGRSDTPVVADQAFNVAEDSPDNTVVGTVSAADPDSGDVLIYTIVAGDPDVLFTLDPTTGVLTVNDGSKLDFEITPTYVLTVAVTDRSLLVDTAAITIHVSDVVYAPVLEMVKEGPETADAGEVVTYTFTISHAVSSDGTPVDTVEVTDSVAGAAVYVSGDTDSDGLFEVGEIWTYTVAYTIQSDDPSPLVNEGTVTAKNMDGTTVSATATHSTLITGYTLDVVLVGNGTVTKDPEWATYRYGNVVTLTAEAAPGWSFDGWSGDAAGTTEGVTVLIDGNKVVTATFSDVPASMSVSVSANPTTVHDPGEMVTYTVRVDNTSAADGITLTGLNSDVHGDLNGQGNCTVPQSIAAGGFYECSFTALVSGVKGEVKTVEVMASGVDEDDNPVSHSDDASVGVVPKIPEMGDYVLFLPLVMRNRTPVAPNLVVEQIVAVNGDLYVSVKNVGNAAVTESFWVDLYVNPAPVPTAVNQIWENLAGYGGVWGVEGDALPLDPDEVLVLQVGGDYYWPDLSRLPDSLAAGTTVYVQVDSANAETTYGAVQESHEMAGGTYDNISSLVLPSEVTVTAQESESNPMAGEQPRTGSDLPLRR